MNILFIKNDYKNFSIINFFTDSDTAINKTQTLEISLNGYLYNKKDLITIVKKKDETFFGKTDAQVILALYELFGKDCLLMIKGVFVFAIRDIQTGSLFIARDKVGGKSLYYSKTENSFIFAPNLKGILKEIDFNKKINKVALAQYLMLSYIPAPLSIVENIYKLSAAHYLTLSPYGEVEVVEYWDLEYDDKELITDYDECKRLLKDTLYRAAEDCLLTDESYGVLLSGGIDSNIITGVLTEVARKKINTFSVGYTGVKDYDESDRAIVSAKLHNANHNLFYIDYSSILGNIDEVIANIDEPFADSSYLPTYTISKIAGKQVRTVYTGDAGDELFAGYNKYLIGYYGNLYRKIPGFLRKGIIEPAVSKLPANRSIVRKMNKIIDYGFMDAFSQRRNMMCLGIGYADVNRLLLYDGSVSLDFIEDIYKKYEHQTNEVNQTLYTDFKVVLEGDMLRKAEYTSELAGVISKAPLLHPDVFELASKIPVEYKIKGKDRKIILKDTFSDFIPKQVASGKKIGFAVPVSYWFKNELKSDLLSTLDRKVIEKQGLLNSEYVDFIVNEHLSGHKNFSGVLWAIYVFEKWYNNYFE